MKSVLQEIAEKPQAERAVEVVCANEWIQCQLHRRRQRWVVAGKACGERLCTHTHANTHNHPHTHKQALVPTEAI